MSTLSGDLIRHRLKTRVIGQNVIYAPQTGSTNTELKRLARQGAPEGLLYVADEQLVGRGRLERSWRAPAGSSLLTSLLFRPGDYISLIQLQQLTMVCALAMADAIEQLTSLSPRLKWPNDLVGPDGKKLAGILTEAEIEENRLNWVVVGLGLNVDIDFTGYTNSEPDRPGKPGSGHLPLAQTATSLSMLLERDTKDLRLPLLQRYLELVEQRYIALQQGASPQPDWQARLIGLNEPITITNLNQNERMEGVLVGVDNNGALLLRRGDGEIMTIVAGDVTLRP
jgi:BirA family biotin operon repressor/biotin-[acetyl-CoA-carboxylase] ligase